MRTANSKSEFQNPKQYRISAIGKHPGRNIAHSNFGFVSIFTIRISDL